MRSGRWETVEVTGGYVPVEALLELGWTPEQLLKEFEARTLSAFGGSDAGLFIPRHQFDDRLQQLDIPTIQQRISLLPRVRAAQNDFRPCSEVARALEIPLKQVKAWVESNLIAWRLRNDCSTPKRRHVQVRLEEVRAMRDARVRPGRISDFTALREAQKLGRRAVENSGTARGAKTTTARR
jgi:hypothetical protein